ncbi:hypothetical protein BJY01DRAFT_218997 [Aspergillus pseudoustus]|uniref:Uncharacterized protein n=1 Tax=Aspergillus pseudoustus TaxID=1810923 RepID=A0ABR4JIR4_9EURO
MLQSIIASSFMIILMSSWTRLRPGLWCLVSQSSQNRQPSRFDHTFAAPFDLDILPLVFQTLSRLEGSQLISITPKHTKEVPNGFQMPPTPFYDSCPLSND